MGILAVKLAALFGLVVLGLLTTDELGMLGRGTAADAALRRLTTQGALALVCPLLIVAHSMLTVALPRSRTASAGMKLMRGFALLVLFLVIAVCALALRLLHSDYASFPANPMAAQWKGALGVAQLAEAGELGWVDHRDLWPLGSTEGRLDQRLARANLALLLVDDRWQPALRAAESGAAPLIETRTRMKVEALISEIEAGAGPQRERYREYDSKRIKARAALEQCHARVEAEAAPVRRGDRRALRSLLARRSPAELAAFEQEQQREYYSHRGTVVHGYDIPLFLDHGRFVAFWEPYLRSRGAAAGYARTRAMSMINQQWAIYSDANRRLLSRIDAAVADGRQKCHSAIVQPFVDIGLDLELDPAGFVLAKAPAEQLPKLRTGLNEIVDPARPQYRLPILRVRDLPFLESEHAIRERLHDRVNRIYEAVFREQAHIAGHVRQPVIRHAVVPSVVMAAASLGLVLNLGLLLAVIFQIALARRLAGSRLLPFSEVLVPAVLLVLMTLARSPFAPGGDLDAAFADLSAGKGGWSGKLYASAIPSQRAWLFLGRQACQLPAVRCSWNDRKPLAARGTQ